ncbi:hypothetical protein HPG69_002940 [Diceros bicornis minor]|uniref:Uncharacterized protein n=1 Tax=Diceros bicornis minor TaxID=77932 RepID=A0A7J7ERF2_DICBM|nr:hypothetical protein HPG69_002940 [Diceros bicornis minor]
MSGVVRTLSRCLLPAEAGGARERRAGGGGARDAEREARRRSRDIDAGLARERRAVRRLVKILLLGAGESGKSTFLKQMRIIHGREFDQKALLEFRDTIFDNILKVRAPRRPTRTPAPRCAQGRPRGPPRPGRDRGPPFVCPLTWLQLPVARCSQPWGAGQGCAPLLPVGLMAFACALLGNSGAVEAEKLGDNWGFAGGGGGAGLGSEEGPSWTLGRGRGLAGWHLRVSHCQSSGFTSTLFLSPHLLFPRPILGQPNYSHEEAPGPGDEVAPRWGLDAGTLASRLAGLPSSRIASGILH